MYCVSSPPWAAGSPSTASLENTAHCPLPSPSVGGAHLFSFTLYWVFDCSLTSHAFVLNGKSKNFLFLNPRHSLYQYNFKTTSFADSVYSRSLIPLSFLLICSCHSYLSCYNYLAILHAYNHLCSFEKII